MRYLLGDGCNYFRKNNNRKEFIEGIISTIIS